MLAVSCTVTSLNTGGSSGTEVSSISGTVIDQNGNPVTDALVRLRPTSFLADSTDDTVYRSTADSVTFPWRRFEQCDAR